MHPAALALGVYADDDPGATGEGGGEVAAYGAREAFDDVADGEGGRGGDSLGRLRHREIDDGRRWRQSLGWGR
jgi:hypothetical protein